jgi:hypothetical protein
VDVLGSGLKALTLDCVEQLVAANKINKKINRIKNENFIVRKLEFKSDELRKQI